MTGESVAVTNRLLERLPAADHARVWSACEPVQLRLDETLAMPGENLEYVYFPTGAVISLLAPTNAKGFLEIAMVGAEGLCSVPLVLGADRSSVRAEVRAEGTALRMKAAAFRRAVAQLPEFRACANLYVHVFMSQLGQSACCGGGHVLGQRVARWLLTASDRANSPHLHMTHEHLSRLLGVRRVGVTEAMGTLERRRLIRCERGRVTIRNRKGLEAAACPCYEANRAIYTSSLG
jgi:CRP-like cAMP-binding protein